MFTRCIFCVKPLGSNHALETFPVGKRLAFDSAKGRLWVVCPRCERWNLTPLEERWEAIERAEQLYRDTRRRVSTDSIGLARLADGTELVRIGNPLRPEFAAWRYGAQLGRRQRRQVVLTAGAVATIAAVTIGGAAVGIGVGGFGMLMLQWSLNHAFFGFPRTIVARFKTPAGGVVRVERQHLAQTSLGRTADGSLAIDLRFKSGQTRFEGRDAERIASMLLPKVNRFGGTKQEVASAVREVESVNGPRPYIDYFSRVAPSYTGRTNKGLLGLQGTSGLALEMSLNEETERRALDGELSILEQAWRDAEEIAAISDEL